MAGVDKSEPSGDQRPGTVVPMQKDGAKIVPPVTAGTEPAAPAKPKRRGRRMLLLVSVPALIAAAGGYFYLNGGRFIETDNAYVQQPMISLSSDVAGRIVEVDVAENQAVHAGDLLFRIDPANYQIALAQAEASLAAARVNVEQLRVGYGSAQAKLESAKQTLELRQSEFDRQSNLVEQGVSSQSSLDDVRLELQSAQSAVTLAEQEVAGSVASLAGDPQIRTDDHPTVRAALAQLENAQHNLDKTIIAAPADGVITQLANLNVGQFVSTGTTMASLVETDQTWVEANFKETQLSELMDGMAAEVSVDAYPGVKFEAHVASIGVATGAEFALIPAQNASGNWIKVTQRIPVRVTVDGEVAVALRAGMSAVVSVDTGKTTLDRMQ